MAPERLEGKEVDARTDIFALGAIVYEMATGKRAFEGKSQASLIAKILETDPPPMSSLHHAGIGASGILESLPFVWLKTHFPVDENLRRLERWSFTIWVVLHRTG